MQGCKLDEWGGLGMKIVLIFFFPSKRAKHTTMNPESDCFSSKNRETTCSEDTPTPIRATRA